MNKVYIEYSDSSYIQMFLKHGIKAVPEKETAHLICFTGGSDVSPHLYGEHKHPYSSVDGSRDEREAELFHYAVMNNIPMVGVCRGGQFLNVMNGGKMYQHIEGHVGDHYMQDLITNEDIMVSSTHHQMMKAAAAGFVVATANICNKSKQHMSPLQEHPAILTNIKKEPDIEVVYYKDTKSLCFQPHPEFDGYERMTAYFFELINRYLKD